MSDKIAEDTFDGPTKSKIVTLEDTDDFSLGMFIHFSFTKSIKKSTALKRIKYKTSMNFYSLIIVFFIVETSVNAVDEVGVDATEDSLTG